MICPHCGAQTNDITDDWHSFPEAEGSEYLSAYVTIWRCPACGTVIGGQGDTRDWVIRPEEAPIED